MALVRAAELMLTSQSEVAMAFVSLRTFTNYAMANTILSPPRNLNYVSEWARATGYNWPPPPIISLRELLLSRSFIINRSLPLLVEVQEISPPFEEFCKLPVEQAPPENLLDPSTVTYSEIGGGPTTTYVHAEGRLVSWLRAVVQTHDPLEVLKQSATSFYLLGIAARNPPDTVEGATALADLAITGRLMYTNFRSLPPHGQPPQDSDLLDDVRNRVKAFQNPPDENRLRSSVAAALDRAYMVAWALRDPNPVTRKQTRASLGWIAVSGEDDSPDRPVNVSSAEFPQFDIIVPSLVPVRTRYIIASAVMPNPNPPSFPTRQIPVDPWPSIPADHEVIIFIHGHDSRAEECADLVNPLLQTGLQHGKKYAIIAFDLPCSGYSDMLGDWEIAPRDATQFTSLPGSSPATFPLLDFLLQFVIDFVNALDARVAIKNRVAAVIGGSLGGNLCLRLGERNDQPWIKNIVAWSPASVWTTFNHDQIKWFALNALQGRMEEEEDKNADGTPSSIPSRIKFFYESFDSPAGLNGPPQPKQWYRDNWESEDRRPVCQSAFIQDDRVERREIYNRFFRSWHWRVALEQLLFSHWPSAFASNRTRTLLLAGSADDFQDPTPGIGVTPRIYTNTKSLSVAMINTPGDSVFLLNTGHSIHNERPLLLAQQIVQFLRS